MLVSGTACALLAGSEDGLAAALTESDRASGGSETKNQDGRGVSKLFTQTVLVVPRHPLPQRIKLARRRIAGDLHIPVLRIPLRNPAIAGRVVLNPPEHCNDAVLSMEQPTDYSHRFATGPLKRPVLGGPRTLPALTNINQRSYLIAVL